MRLLAGTCLSSRSLHGWRYERRDGMQAVGDQADVDRDFLEDWSGIFELFGSEAAERIAMDLGNRPLGDMEAERLADLGDIAVNHCAWGGTSPHVPILLFVLAKEAYIDRLLRMWPHVVDAPEARQ